MKGMDNFFNITNFAILLFGNCTDSEITFYSAQAESISQAAIFMSIGIILSIVFGTVSILYFLVRFGLAVHKRRIRRNNLKRWIFIVNMASSDLLQCAGTLVCIIAIQLEEGFFAKFLTGIAIFCLIMLTKYTSMLSYVGLSILQLIAVKYPLYYKSNMTVKRSVIAVACTWTLSVIFVGLIPSFILKGIVSFSSIWLAFPISWTILVATVLGSFLVVFLLVLQARNFQAKTVKKPNMKYTHMIAVMQKSMINRKGLSSIM